ncbi:hypothetical protein H8S90_24155 [Olivibacter sp. SDN3]|uniref:hypothetical protein n=1 Tax=Olivibacter sp. SDN3 TaxID=2764720 RepID=UPI0016519042|nr:hypothetical protein [Olivibacter sp. SDN3]QNL49764.1 hypothetical protein H8S90_24155 [Olivibacter sp. SDN3]
MIRLLMGICLCFIFLLGYTQEIDADLLKVKKRLDAVQQFSATVVLDLEVSFINMPTKTAKVYYEEGKRMKFSSDDFVMLPRRGLDFSLSEIFRYPFITVDRGMEQRDGKLAKVINVIPTDKLSELALVTLYIDQHTMRILASEINTRKEGSYTLSMRYASTKDVLPSHVEASFALERLKIPLNFMGKDTEIDRKQMKSQETKTGIIKMQLKDYDIQYRS